jgi:hypothetical protein
MEDPPASQVRHRGSACQLPCDVWGITDNDVVIDLQYSPFRLSSRYSTHPITQNLTENYIVILPPAQYQLNARRKRHADSDPDDGTTGARRTGRHEIPPSGRIFSVH